MTSQIETLLVERRGAALWLTLNRPEVLNAFDGGMLLRLRASLREAKSDPAIRAVVITGAGRAFSAGQDVRELLSAERVGDPGSAVESELRDYYSPILLGIRELPVPVIAAINGVTAGAAFGVALACDLRIADPEATFVAAPYRVGFMPAIGISRLLPAIVGLGRASELAFFNERFDVRQAHEAGLISRISELGDLIAETERAVETIAALPAQAVALTKEAFNAAMLPDFASHLEREAVWQGTAARHTDHHEGIAALLEHRPPQFAGIRPD
jgi:2-(1,2-epoxy-1,2-dihydrophenyl)acetyl-CoA isomerase